LTTKKQKEEAPKVEDVAVPTIECLENLVSKMEEQTSTKFERFFLPALAVFSATIIGMFVIIYSITQDMTRLANSMDPNMGGNMSAMVSSIEKLSNNVSQMTVSVAHMQKNFSQVNKNMDIIAKKLDNLDSISTDLTLVSAKMDALEPMLINMEEMNKNMTTMQDSMTWMQRDLSILRASFSRPMSVINKMPFPF
jgi:ABC-type multidrug transport system fused ATPase/permease subunit